MLQHLLYYSAVGRDVNLSSLFSLIPLYRFSYLPPLFPYFSPSLASMLLLFMSAISSLYARYLFGLKPNIYRTSTEHELVLLACSILVTLELLTGYIGDVPLIGMISVFLPLLQNVVSLGEKGCSSGSNMPFCSECNYYACKFHNYAFCCNRKRSYYDY